MFFIATQALPQGVKEYCPQFLLPSTEARFRTFIRHQVLSNDSCSGQNPWPWWSHGRWLPCGSKPRLVASVVKETMILFPCDASEPLIPPFEQVWRVKHLWDGSPTPSIWSFRWSCFQTRRISRRQDVVLFFVASIASVDFFLQKRFQ